VSIEAALRWLSLPTYDGASVGVSLGQSWTIYLPDRLDLFAFEVVESACGLLSPAPTTIVFGIDSVRRITRRGVTNLLELSRSLANRNIVGFHVSAFSHTPLKEELATRGFVWSGHLAYSAYVNEPHPGRVYSENSIVLLLRRCE
jgi:hypothetical protein